MVEKSRFPMVFEKCPNCGSLERICQLAYDEEVEKNRAKPSFASDMSRIVTPLTEPAKAALTVNILIKHYDDCAKCGMRYCVRDEIAQGGIGMMPGQPPQGMRGSGFPQNDPRLKRIFDRGG